MDCRKTLGLLMVLGGLAGCTPNSLLPLLPSSDPEPTKTPNSAWTEPISKEKVKEMKPATWVAIGDYREQMATVQTASPADQAKLADTARQAYELALAKDPKYTAAYVGLARHWEQHEQHDRAVVCYTEALKLTPSSGGLWFEAGMCQFKHKEWDGALERLQKAATLDTTNRQFVAGYAVCLAGAERYDESLSWFKKVYGEAEAYCNLGRTLHRMNRDNLSRQQLLQALLLDPDLKAAQDLLAEMNAAVAHVDAPAALEAAPPGNQ